MFLFLSTFLPSFLGLSHSCTASKHNPLVPDSSSLDFQQSQVPADPAPPIPSEICTASCATARIQFKQQARGLLSQPQPQVLYQQHHWVSFSHKGPQTDIALPNKSHLQHLQDDAYIHQPKKKSCSYCIYLKQEKKQQQDSRHDRLLVLWFPLLIAEFPATTNRAIIYKSGKFVNSDDFYSHQVILPERCKGKNWIQTPWML